MSRVSTNKWFVTISAYNSGDGLDDVQIGELRSYIAQYCKTFCQQHILVLEQNNHKHETFKHLHLYIENKKEQTQDVVRKKWIKVLKDKNSYNNKKDLDVRGAINPYVLIGGYLTKTDDYEILLQSLNEDFQNKCVEMSASYTKRVCVLKGKKCPTLNEAPFTFEIFIRSNNLDYDGTSTSFKNIFYLMTRSREYGLTSLYGKLTKVKATLDILMLDDHKFSDLLIDNEILREDYQHKVEIVYPGDPKQIKTIKEYV